MHLYFYRYSYDISCVRNKDLNFYCVVLKFLSFFSITNDSLNREKKKKQKRDKINKEKITEKK